MIFVFENGKIAKVPINSYETKINRKRLINAYSNKQKLIGIKHILEDEDIILIRDDDKALLLNTSQVTEKATKNSIGIQIFNLKKDSFITKFLEKEQFISEDIEHYRGKNLPSAGHFIIEKDKLKNKSIFK